MQRLDSQPNQGFIQTLLKGGPRSVLNWDYLSYICAMGSLLVASLLMDCHSESGRWDFTKEDMSWSKSEIMPKIPFGQCSQGLCPFFGRGLCRPASTTLVQLADIEQRSLEVWYLPCVTQAKQISPKYSGNPTLGGVACSCQENSLDRALPLQGLTLVFTGRKSQADYLEDFLTNSKFPATAIHGDLTQAEREFVSSPHPSNSFRAHVM